MLIKNDLVSKFQSGFRALHSATTALLFAMDDWLLNMDKRLINFVKRHLTLLIIKLCFKRKLELYGVQGTSLAVFKSYLIIFGRETCAIVMMMIMMMVDYRIGDDA